MEQAEDAQSNGRDGERGGRLQRALARASPGVFSLYAVMAAFVAYFSMYAFRKPFAVAQYEGLSVAGFDLKTALVISQVCGYALSKFLGIKINSEIPPARRAGLLLVLIGCAEAALLLLAVVPPELKPVAIFFNGLPLGMVWGAVFGFLEGRRTSEILGAGLSCSYIVASGAVKTVGAGFMGMGVSEAWMPALTGLVFLPPFVLAVWGLWQLPAPSAEDVEARTDRAPMTKVARREFLRRYGPGVVLLVVVYFFVTAYRDFRDNFAAEIWAAMGYGNEPAVFTLSELPIALSVMGVLALLYLVRDNRIGLMATYGIMLLGCVLIGVATLLFDAGLLSGMVWMVLVGLGLYLAYVPYGCVLFDRMIAAVGVVATAVFMIYVSDAVGYLGSVALLMYKELGQPELSALDFFRGFSYLTCVLSIVGFVLSALYFRNRMVS